MDAIGIPIIPLRAVGERPLPKPGPGQHSPEMQRYRKERERIETARVQRELAELACYHQQHRSNATGSTPQARKVCINERRRTICSLLREHGRLTREQLSPLLGCGRSSTHTALRCNWFVRDAALGYRLTEEGERQWTTEHRET